MKFTLNRFLSRTTGVIAFAMIVAPVFAAGPKTDSNKIPRVDNITGQVSAASYNLESTSKYNIKFESKSSGLGENGADQTDTFVLDLSEINNFGAVSVKTKADTTTAYSTLSSVGSNNLDNQGFLVTVVDRTDDRIVISIRSDSNRSALSHVSFTIMTAMYD